MEGVDTKRESQLTHQSQKSEDSWYNYSNLDSEEAEILEVVGLQPGLRGGGNSGSGRLVVFVQS